MRLIAFITERSVIVRILEHLGDPIRAPRMAPIRGPPSIDALQQRDDRGTRRSLNPDPAVDVMPDLRGAFAIGSGELPKRVALVDDVMTTGATLAEATKTLKGAGVEWVELWVLARLP